jgi:hypothetical protein
MLLCVSRLRVRCWWGVPWGVSCCILDPLVRPISLDILNALATGREVPVVQADAVQAAP